MLSYLQKFNDLPPELRSLVSSPEAMRAISELEEKYGISLATVIMKLMIKDISIVDLAKFFVFEFNLNAREAEQLVEDMKERLFYKAADYLGFSPDSAVGDEENEADSVRVLDDWMAKKKQETAVRGSNFFFSPEDEEEVKELAKKLGGIEGDGKGQSQNQIEENIDAIVRESGINFSSEDLNNRCRQIVKTYLKGVRSRIDTRQALSRGIDSGGLDLDINSIERIIAASNKYKPGDEQAPARDKNKEIELPAKNLSVNADDILKGTKKDEPAGKKSPEPGVGAYTGPARDFEYDFSKLKKPDALQNREKEAPEAIEKEAEAGPTADEVLASYQNKKRPQSKWEDVLSADKEIKRVRPMAANEPDERQAGAGQDSGLNINRPAWRQNYKQESGKVRMDDVKYVPKLTGPIDELAEMDLVNFRRLSSDPKTAIGKIMGKIELLEEENFAKRLEGIKAWRQSPINKMYLSAGQESIQFNKPIKIILAEKKSSEGEAITYPEFNAVMELNKSLRF